MLRPSVSLLKATLESAADGILAVDLARRIVLLQPPFRGDFPHSGRGPGPPGRRVRVGFRARCHARPRWVPEQDRSHLRSPGRDQLRSLRAQGRRLIECYSLPLHLTGAVVGRVWSHRDVTARVRAEQQRDRLLLEERRARAGGEDATACATSWSPLPPTSSEHRSRACSSSCRASSGGSRRGWTSGARSALS